MTWPPRWRRELREPIPETVEREPYLDELWFPSVRAAVEWTEEVAGVECRVCPTCKQPCPIEGFKAHTDWCSKQPKGVNDG